MDDRESFQCRVCKQHHPTTNASKSAKLTLKGTGVCKPCHSNRTKLDHFRKKVETTPENYYECNDCDRYMNKYADRWGNKPPITNCKYCDSEDLEQVQ